MEKFCKNKRCSVSGFGACKAWEQCAFFEWDVEKQTLKSCRVQKQKSNSFVPKEEEEQKVLYAWCKENGIELVHIPNERKCNAATGARLALQGVRSGFPDNFIIGAQKGFHGLFIELKRQVKSLSRLSKEQKDWIKILNDSGYKAAVCYGADEAINEIVEYFKEEKL